MFSDGCLIRQFNCNCTFVRRLVNQKFSSQDVTPTVLSAPSVMVWGAITVFGRAGLHFVPNGDTVTQRNYFEIIKAEVPLHMQIHNSEYFQHDAASVHMPYRAQSVSTWL